MKRLDHGYIKVIEHWGSDERIIEAARMSVNRGFLGWEPGPCPDCEGIGRILQEVDDPATETRQVQISPIALVLEPEPSTKWINTACPSCDGKGTIKGDKHLLSFLWKNGHATPFEMAGAIIEVKAPIMVFREWHRHRTQGYNEMSARYTPLPDENYVPTIDRLLLNSKTNKQAGVITGAAELTPEVALEYQARLAEMYVNQQALYEWALASGVPKELARLHLGVGRYSKMRATAVLRNWLGFLSLRLPSNAQWEIRQFAEGLHDQLQDIFPRTMGLFDETRKAA